ncbi:hypothetical protein [Rappaport israeli]|uniref:hypothetical protein n=1 Tax=Rappaport israeli TaxID=1839807 RepID=UPI000B12ABA2|nr:hypothetical protein [Rappaport israeli]
MSNLYIILARIHAFIFSKQNHGVVFANAPITRLTTHKLNPRFVQAMLKEVA